MMPITRSGWLPGRRPMSKETQPQKAQNSQNKLLSSVRSVCSVFAFVVISAGAAWAQPSFPTAIPQTKFDSGQDTQPYFEGWIKNADGTFDMVFGYFNRNWKEEPIVPAGEKNSVEPGGPDKG